jgi:hypothetical protein
MLAAQFAAFVRTHSAADRQRKGVNAVEGGAGDEAIADG